ncbi:hypothetical protein Tco_1485984 [Tanacetum coccineum]
MGNPSDPVEDESPVEEVSSVKAKKVSDIKEAAHREAAKLKGEELALQLETLELLRKKKMDKDLIFYNSRIAESLPQLQQMKLMEMKQ